MPSAASHLFLATVVFWTTALPSIAAAQTAELSDLIEKHRLAGVSIVTRCGDNLVTEEHGGFRDLDTRLKVDSATAFRVASISKAVVALAAAKLAEQGTLDPDAPIGKYLKSPPVHPALPTADITLRHLLSHTSGLRDGAGYGTFLAATYAAIPAVPLLSAVLDSNGAYYTADMWDGAGPGSAFHYANINFGVAATVLEAATGWRFDMLMENLLFGPFGIDAGFQLQDLDDPTNLAALYRQQGGEWVPQADHLQGELPPVRDWTGYLPGTNAVGFAPQGGLRTSARSLSLLARLWSHGSAPGADGNPLTFLGPAARAQMSSPQWSYDGSNGDNGHGLFNQWASGLHLAASGLGEDDVVPGLGISPFIGHPGEAYGLVSDAYATPDGAWNMVFLTNGKWDGYAPADGSAFYAVEQDVFARLKDDALQCLAQQVPASPAMQWSVVAGTHVGDTLVRIQPSQPVRGTLPCQLFTADGRLIFDGDVEADGRPGRKKPEAISPAPTVHISVPPLGRGIHFGTVECGDKPPARFIFLVTG